MRSTDLLPADVVFTRGDTLLGRMIRWGERSRGECSSQTNHAAVVVGAGDPAQARIVESMQHVRTGPLGQLHSKDYCWVFRPLNVDPYSAGRVTSWALAQVGRRYGYGQLILQLLDAKIFRGRNVFRRIAAVDPRPICSRLVATAYRDVLGLDFGVPAYAADPDTMMDFCLRNPDKYLRVWEGVPS
jgi:uncharacterized protein YycO